MDNALNDTTIALVGGNSGIGREIARQVVAAGARVIVTGRSTDGTVADDSLGDAAAYEPLDLSDADSIDDFARRVGRLDHVVSLAADHANGRLAGLARADVERAFAAKVIGPLQLAGRLAARIEPGGSFVFFSGVAAWRPAPGLAVMATTNGAVSFMAAALAVELAPLRVNAVSPGIVDSGAWDAMGDDRDAFFAETAQANPARRVGAPADVAQVVVTALANPFITGTTLHVDGGGRLA